MCRVVLVLSGFPYYKAIICYNLNMKTFEYRLRPNRKQEQALLSVLIASRKLYNHRWEQVKCTFSKGACT